MTTLNLNYPKHERLQKAGSGSQVLTEGHNLVVGLNKVKFPMFSKLTEVRML